jgi:hypothetical protein
LRWPHLDVRCSILDVPFLDGYRNNLVAAEVAAPVWVGWGRFQSNQMRLESSDP